MHSSFLAAAVAVALSIPSAKDLPLRHALHGFSLELPAWKQTVRSTVASAGALHVEDPNDARQFFELRWVLGDAVTDDELKQMWLATGLQVRGTMAVPVDKVDGKTWALGVDRSPVLTQATVWRCPGDPRLAILSSALVGDIKSAVRRHAAVVTTVRCTGVPESARPLFPVVATPSGFTRSEEAGVLGFEATGSGRGEASLVFPSELPGDSLDNFAAAPQLGASLMKGVAETALGLEDFQMLGKADVVEKGQRVFFTGAGRVEGKPAVLTLTLWRCPSGKTFMGYLADSTDTQRDFARARELVSSAKCP